MRLRITLVMLALVSLLSAFAAGSTPQTFLTPIGAPNWSFDRQRSYP